MKGKFLVSDKEFRTSSHTGRNNSIWRCVEVAMKPEGVAVRNSTGDKTTLFYTHDEWDAFIKGVKGGEFDLKV